MNTLRNHSWSILLSVFYAALVISGVWYLSSIGDFSRNVGMPDFFLMAIAVWRLTRLTTYDAIMQFVRDWFAGARPSTLRGTLHTLVNCPWCTGLWFGFFVVFFYFYTPYAWPVLLILAISAVGSFFQVISNSVGWGAELKKIQVQKLRDSLETNVEVTD